MTCQRAKLLTASKKEKESRNKRFLMNRKKKSVLLTRNQNKNLE